MLRVIKLMAKIRTKYVCQSCGYETSKWMGKCPECMKWNSFVEEIEEKKTKKEVFIIDKYAGDAVQELGRMLNAKVLSVEIEDVHKDLFR